MDKACPFSSSAIQNLVIIAMFKLIALRDTLVYDSDNWCTNLLTLVRSFRWCVLFLRLAKLYRRCPIHDKAYCRCHSLFKTPAIYLQLSARRARSHLHFCLLTKDCHPPPPPPKKKKKKRKERKKERKKTKKEV